MRQKLTPAWVRDVAPETTNKIYWDTEQRGFGLLVLPSGEKRYVIQYRAIGRSRRMTFKPGLTLTEARKEAKAKLGEVAKGGDPLAEKHRKEGEAQNTLKAIVEEYFKREGYKLRSADYRLAAFKRLVFPKLGSRQIDTIKRSEINRLLDKIEEERGPSMAHLVLAFISKVMNWYAVNEADDDFVSPIRRGMGRINPQEHSRDRVLDDEELRVVWRTAEATEGPFGHLVRFLLLTVTRRNEAAMMARAEVLPDCNWIIPAGRMKGKREHVVPLSPAAKAVLGDVPNLGRYVFTTTGRGPIKGFGKFKAKFDAAVLADLRKDDPKAEPLPNWTLHDLRRTARSLMSRAKVSPDIAERVMAHKIGGIRGVYDRYEYLDEKRDALEKLAALIGIILTPKADNVVPLRSGTEGAA
jgi:integrase